MESDALPVAERAAELPPAPLGVRALAGLECGIAGGLVMLLWFLADSWLRGEFIWKIPHLFASLYYGDRIFRASFGVITLAGIALLLVAAGIVGILFGCLVSRPPHILRLSVGALVVSMCWYWFNQTVLWRHGMMLVPLYVVPSTMVVAHILYGLVLSRYSRALNRLGQALADSPVLK
jgi:hypothetical protein